MQIHRAGGGPRTFFFLGPPPTVIGLWSGVWGVRRPQKTCKHHSTSNMWLCGRQLPATWLLGSPAGCMSLRGFWSVAHTIQVSQVKFLPIWNFGIQSDTLHMLQTPHQSYPFFFSSSMSWTTDVWVSGRCVPHGLRSYSTHCSSCCARALVCILKGRCNLIIGPSKGLHLQSSNCPTAPQKIVLIPNLVLPFPTHIRIMVPTPMECAHAQMKVHQHYLHRTTTPYQGYHRIPLTQPSHPQ